MFDFIGVFSCFTCQCLISVFLIACICFSVSFSDTIRWNYQNMLPTVCVLIQTVILVFLFCFADGSNVGITAFNGSLHQKLDSEFFEAFTGLLVAFSLVFAVYYSNKKRIHQYEYVLIFLISFLALVIICPVFDFMSFFLGIELQSLAFYVLATFFWSSEFNVESGIKYFILGSFNSCLLLLGISILYMTTGSLSFETFANFLTDSVETLVLLVGIMFILISMLFKVGAFPFHVLICDIYEGALTSTTVFFVVVPKAVTFYIIFKLCYLSFAQHEQILQDLLFAVGTLSIITSAVVALYQKRIKRLLAFSTISHTGFLLLSAGCFSIESIKSLVFYLPIYALMSIVVFYIISLSFSKFGFLKYIINWLSFYRKNLTISIMFSICLFSMAGIPPFTGFFSKLLVFVAMIKNSSVFLSVLVAVASCISCFYYIRIIKLLFFYNTQRSEWLSVTNRNAEFIVSFFTLIICFYLLNPNSLIATAAVVALSFNS